MRKELSIRFARIIDRKMSLASQQVANNTMIRTNKSTILMLSILSLGTEKGIEMD
jgi:hypothetical protein